MPTVDLAAAAAHYQATPKLPRALSPSGLATWRQCPTRWAFEKVLRVQTASGAPAIIGIHVHRVLEVVMALPAGLRTVDRAVQTHEQLWDGLRTTVAAVTGGGRWTPRFPTDGDIERVAGHTDDEHLTRLALQLLTVDPDDLVDAATKAQRSVEAYWQMSRDPNTVTVMAVEPAIRSQWGDTPVYGIIDRVDRLPNGNLSVVDYKTGKVPNPTFGDGYLDQLRFYAGLVRDQYGTLPQVGLLLYLPAQTPVTLTVDPDDIARFEQDVTCQWDAAVAAFPTLDYEPSPGPLCGWCPFVGWCPPGAAEVRTRAAAGRLRDDAPARTLLEIS